MYAVCEKRIGCFSLSVEWNSCVVSVGQGRVNGSYSKRWHCIEFNILLFSLRWICHICIRINVFFVIHLLLFISYTALSLYKSQLFLFSFAEKLCTSIFVYSFGQWQNGIHFGLAWVYLLVWWWRWWRWWYCTHLCVCVGASVFTNLFNWHKPKADGDIGGMGVVRRVIEWEGTKEDDTKNNGAKVKWLVDIVSLMLLSIFLFLYFDILICKHHSLS